jgi:hypothetical protein
LDVRVAEHVCGRPATAAGSLTALLITVLAAWVTDVAQRHSHR